MNKKKKNGINSNNSNKNSAKNLNKLNPSNDRDKMIENSRANQKIQQLINKKDFFQQEINQYLAQQPQAKPFEEINLIEDQDDKTLEGRDFTICIRARPLLQHELEANFYNIVTALNPNMVLHQTKFNVKGVAVVESQNFNVDLAFGQNDDNDTLYQQTGRPLVKLALQGGVGAMFAYGQTGSGKTFTMQGIQQRISKEIFQFNRENHEIYVGFFQLLGNKATDLLVPEQKVEIMEDKFGKVQTPGLQEQQVFGEKEFLDLVNQAQANRKTQATFKNEVSSRTHSICQVRVQNPKLPSAENGYIYLIDLVGSENASDSQFHDKALFNETKDINKSLMALKECIRNRALASAEEKYIHVPFRQSKLTLLLKDSFDMDTFRQTKTVVVANIAPSIADIQQTYNTLRYAAPIKVSTSNKKSKEINPNNPQFWDNEKLKEYMGKVCWKYYKKVKVDMGQFLPFESGKQALNMNEGQFIQRLVDLGYPEKSGKQVHDQFYKKFIDNRFADRKKLQQKAGKLVQPDMQFHGAKQNEEQQQQQQDQKQKQKKPPLQPSHQQNNNSINQQQQQKEVKKHVKRSLNNSFDHQQQQEQKSPRQQQYSIQNNNINIVKEENIQKNPLKQQKNYYQQLQKKSSLAQQGQNILQQHNQSLQQLDNNNTDNNNRDNEPVQVKNNNNIKIQQNNNDMDRMPITQLQLLNKKKQQEKMQQQQQLVQQQQEVKGFSMDTLEEQEQKYQQYKQKQQVYEAQQNRQNQAYVQHHQQQTQQKNMESQQRIHEYRDKVNSFQQQKFEYDQQQQAFQQQQQKQKQDQQQQQNLQYQQQQRGKWVDQPKNNFDETLSYHYNKDLHNTNYKGNNYYPGNINTNQQHNQQQQQNNNNNNQNQNIYHNNSIVHNNNNLQQQQQNLYQNNQQQLHQFSNNAQQILNNNFSHIRDPYSNNNNQQQQLQQQQQNNFHEPYSQPRSLLGNNNNNPSNNNNNMDIKNLNNYQQRQMYQQFLQQQQQQKQNPQQHQQQQQNQFLQQQQNNNIMAQPQINNNNHFYQKQNSFNNQQQQLPNQQQQQQKYYF